MATKSSNDYKSGYFFGVLISSVVLGVMDAIGLTGMFFDACIIMYAAISYWRYGQGT
jgi:hypothetical protein